MQKKKNLVRGRSRGASKNCVGELKSNYSSEKD